MNYTYSKYLIDKSFLLVILLISSSLSLLGQTPSGFSYTATPMSGTFYGQAQIDDIPASEGDWIGAFDSEGNCAGAVPLTIYGGVAYINLIIYGDDATSLDIDEGMNTGEDFFLRLFDVSNGETYEYQSPLSIQSFDGWYSNNGAPLSNYDNTSGFVSCSSARILYLVFFVLKVKMGDDKHIPLENLARHCFYRPWHKGNQNDG
jgi:hypothetical protein